MLVDLSTSLLDSGVEEVSSMDSDSNLSCRSRKACGFMSLFYIVLALRLHH